MQDKLGGPRAALTEAEVDEVLLHAAGGRIRWGVDVYIEGILQNPSTP